MIEIRPGTGRSINPGIPFEIRGPLPSRNFFITTDDNGNLVHPLLYEMGPETNAKATIRVKVATINYERGLMVCNEVVPSDAINSDGGPEQLLRMGLNAVVQAACVGDLKRDLASYLYGYNKLASKLAKDHPHLFSYPQKLALGNE